MRPRWKILISLAGAVCAVILVAVVRHYQLRMATQAYIAQLRAEGEPMDLAAVLPPPVPPEKNGANTFRQAAELINTNTTLLKTNYDILTTEMVAPGKAMISWQQPDIREVTVTNSWQQLATAVAQNMNVFALLHQIAGKPDFDFQIQYGGGGTLAFQSFGLSDSKKATEWLSVAAVYHLHAGDAASAVDDVRAMLALTQALRDERFAISELVRIAMARIAVGVTWEILQSPAVTDAQLAQLQNGWTNLDFIKSGENALAMERVGGAITLAKWRASPALFASDLKKDQDAAAKYGLDDDDEESFLARATTKPRIYLWRYWWSYPDQLRSLKGYEVLLTSMRMAQTNGSFASAMDYQTNELEKLRFPQDNDGLFAANPDFHSLLSQSIAVMVTYIKRIRAAAVAQQIATTAIALKRYQLKNGNYPLNLDALVPEFLPVVPLDPVDGKPLRYRSDGNADGTYLLYSVGLNLRDDGGNPALEGDFVEGRYTSWLDNHRLDWVWPQPATEAEIRNYRAHPPK